MKETIEFEQFSITDTGFTCIVKSSKREEEREELFWVLESREKRCMSLDEDSVAYTLSTLCGTAYTNIFMDLSVSYECCVRISNFTKATIKTSDYTVMPGQNTPTQKKEGLADGSGIMDEGVILSFSGGFDSLAALALLSDVPELHLVSIDFGGSLSREKVFFSQFPVNIVHTNFRQLQYNREHWTFMGTGAMLFAKILGAKYHVFGSILEASPKHFLDAESSCFTPPISYVGLTDWYVVKGLTEVATTMVVMHYYPDKIHDSLKSLARRGSEKLWRKYLLGTIICGKYGIPITLEKPPLPQESQIRAFGKEFARDFLALYELKYAGKKAVEKTVCEIPQEVYEFIEGVSLEFYEKLNTNFLYSLPDTIQDSVLQKLEAAGIVPYTDKDWDEFTKVKEFLGKWYPTLL